MGYRVQEKKVSCIVNETVQPGDVGADRDDNFDQIVRHFLDGPHYFQSAVVHYLYEWWRGYSPALPQRKQFDLVEHASIAPNLFLIKVLGNGEFEYRINGEQVVSLVGVSLKGEVIAPSHGDIAMVNLAHYYQEIVDKRLARTCTGTLRSSDLERVNFETVDCPLVDKNSEITHIVGAIGTV